jgi:hypothetical protein
MNAQEGLTREDSSKRHTTRPNDGRELPGACLDPLITLGEDLEKHLTHGKLGVVEDPRVVLFPQPPGGEHHSRV